MHVRVCVRGYAWVCTLARVQVLYMQLSCYLPCRRCMHTRVHGLLRRHHQLSGVEKRIGATVTTSFATNCHG